MYISMLTRRAVIDKDTNQLLLYDEGGACVVAKLPICLLKSLANDLTDWVGEIEQADELKRLEQERTIANAEDAREEHWQRKCSFGPAPGL